MMDIRHTKILRDLWLNKSRTLLVVLSIAVGAAAFGLMITGRIVLEQNLADEYARSNPAQSVLSVSPFSDDVLDVVRRQPDVQAAEGRHLMQAKLQAAPDQWLSMEIHGIADFGQIAINRLKAQAGTVFPPPDGTIILERSISQLSDLQIGQKVHLQTPDGKTHDLEISGFVNDLSRQPTNISLVAYGYVTLPTLKSLGEPTTYNQLYIALKDLSLDRVSIEQKVSAIVKAVEAAGVQVYSAPVPPPGKQVMNDSMSSVLLILGVLGALTLALSGFLVINIMSALLGQQIPQIGILKSLGSPSSQLMRLYFEMVLWLGLMGLALAVPMGLLGAYSLAQGLSDAMNFDVTRFSLPVATLGLQVFGAIGVPLIAAVVPIFVGSRITIREAISGVSPESTGKTNLLSGLMVTVGERSQLMRLSIGNTFRRKGRLILTLTTLSLAGSMFIALLGIREAMRQAVSDIQNSLNYDVSLTFAQPYPTQQIQQEAGKVAGVAQTESWGLADGRRLYEDGHLSGSISLIAVQPDTQMTKPTITQGRWLQDGDDYVLFVNADMLELAPDLAVGKSITLKIGQNEHLWTIIGVSAREFSPAAYIPYSTYEQVTGLKDQTSMLVVRTTDGSPEAESAVEQSLLNHFAQVQVDQQIVVQGVSQTVQMPVQIVGSSTTTALKTASASSLDILIVLLMAMTLIITVVGALGLAITMGLNVLERTREIGILRALGGANGVIRRVVMVEGLLIGLISWGIGAVLSIGLGMWLGQALGISLLAHPLDYQFPWPALALWLLLICLVAAVASLIPAQNATRLSIRDTIAYIG